MALGLCLGDPALVDQTLNKRVVVGDLGERAIAQKVGAGVADVRDRDLVACSQQCSDRSAHALQLRLALYRVSQLGVRRAQHLREPVQSLICAGVLTVETDHLADRDRACNIACGVAAHSIGDDEQVRTGIPRVLVLLSYQSDVRASSVVQRDGQNSPTSAARRWSCRSAGSNRPRSAWARSVCWIPGRCRWWIRGPP